MTQSSETFIADFHEGEMDMSKLLDKTYIVGLNSSSRASATVVSNTIRGPYDFFEMVEAVGSYYHNKRIHCKIIILDKMIANKIKYLDLGTTDYIEAHWKKIIEEYLFEAAVFDKTLEPVILEEEQEKEEVDV